MSVSEDLTGHFTLPAQAGMDKEVKMLCQKWGVDAIRDSDGTVLSRDILSLGPSIYSTVCLIRADQKWAQTHPDQCQQKFLMSFPVTCKDDGTLDIKIQTGYSKEQFKIDTLHDPKKYWQVFDRTTGSEISTDAWDYRADSEEVVVRTPEKWHVYTINFLVYQIWETTSMYNYITNNWAGEHQKGVDPYQLETREHLLGYLDQWIQAHPNTDFVRFTSMFYQFPLMKNEKRENVYLDWSGYLDPISPLALDEFEKEMGYRLKSEDIVDKGYFNASYRVPQEKFLDWMGFVQKFVRGYTKQCVDKVHAAGKKAALFFCDHWIGTEPYLDGFEEIGFDVVIGPCLSGVELRRISDVPGDHLTEVRLYPYFFEVDLQDEPVFRGDGDPVTECKKWWKGIRRALLRRCVDRIGFGGYLDLAVKYPDFLDYVETLAGEFRTILARTQKTLPYSLPKKVALLDAWGKCRSWMHNDSWPEGHIPECLSGLPVDVLFMSFDDIRQNGIGDDVGVIINWGSANSAWSGGHHWSDPVIVERIREWVAAGGGFIGVEDPTAYEHQGQFFQLADVLGVQKEVGNRLSWAKNIRPDISKDHFVLQDIVEEIDLNVPESKVHLDAESAELLVGSPDQVLVSTHQFGGGRAVYFADYMHNAQNIRLFYRAILWASSQEEALVSWASDNINTDCAFYPEVDQFIIMNNSEQSQQSTVYNAEGKSTSLKLEPLEMKWFSREQIDQLCQ